MRKLQTGRLAERKTVKYSNSRCAETEHWQICGKAYWQTAKQADRQTFRYCYRLTHLLSKKLKIETKFLSIKGGTEIFFVVTQDNAKLDPNDKKKLQGY